MSSPKTQMVSEKNLVAGWSRMYSSYNIDIPAENFAGTMIRTWNVRCKSQRSANTTSRKAAISYIISYIGGTGKQKHWVAWKRKKMRFPVEISLHQLHGRGNKRNKPLMVRILVFWHHANPEDIQGFIIQRSEMTKTTVSKSLIILYYCSVLLSSLPTKTCLSIRT